MPKMDDRRDTNFQATVEAFIWGTAYNVENSPLYRIPEEILAMIVESLDDDQVTLLCLGQASSRLRRIVYAKPPPASVRPSMGFHQDESTAFLTALEDRYKDLRRTSTTGWNQLRYLLRTDRLCDSCIQHSDLELVPTGQPVSPSSPATPLEIRSNGNKPWDGCKFTTADRLNTLFCSGCQALHSIRAFSKQQMRLGEDERICIGREGVFRLCKHEYVQWSDIEDHFLQQHGQPGTRSRLVPTTSQMRCEHPSHLGDGSHKLLLQDELPRLVLEGSCTSNYKITRVWERHHSFPLGDSQGGRFCPSAVRSRLRDDLSNAAGEIISGGHSTTTAALNKAMRCFASPSCSCLHYGNYGDGGVAQTQPKGFFDCHDSDSKTKHTSHNPVSVNPCDWDSETIQVTRCLETQLEDQPSRGCVVVRYKRVLSGLAGLTHTTERNEPDVPIVPPHEWFHALDPDSYEMEDHPVVVGNVWPACRDVACGNYYATRQVTHCNNRTHF